MNLVTFTPSYYPDPTKGKPLGGGFVYIGEPDTDPTVEVNQKTVSVLQENGNLVEVAQPITLNAGGSPTYNGSVVSIFVTGDYSSTVQDSNAAQFSYTPRTTSQEATGTQFPVWDIGTTYAQNAYVTGSDNRLYYSIAGANLGNDPTSTSGSWQGFVQEGDDFIGDVAATDGTVVLDSGTDGTDATFTGDIIGDVSGSSGGVVAIGTTTGTGVLKAAMFVIGDWDMSAATGSSSTTVTATGVNGSLIRRCDVVIHNDAETASYDLGLGVNATDTSPQGFVANWQRATANPVITLRRLTGGTFDTTDFDETPLNRGILTVWYEG